MNDTVKIVNLLQVNRYIKNGAKPIDICIGNKDILVYVFRKSDTRELYTKWLNRELH